MRPKRSRALLGTSIAAALAAAAFAGPVQANSTLPGVNGKIAFTTNADTIPAFEFLGAQTRGTDQQNCYPPIPFFSLITGVGGDVMWCGAEINTINPDGSAQTAVTDDFGSDDGAAWSSQNGSSIAYESSKGGTCDSVNPQTCNYDIWVSNADGTNSRQLTSGILNEVHPSFSPDESKIAFDGLNPFFSAEAGSATKDLVDPTLEQFDHIGQSIYTMPSAGGTPTPLLPSSETDPSQTGGLVSDSQAAWSPDGSQIAFTRLTLNSPTIDGASTKLAVSTDLTLTTGIYVAPASGGASHEVGSPQQCDVSGAVIPFLLQAAEAGKLGSVSKTVRGTTQTNCTLDVAPAWSPDGSKLAFERITYMSEPPVGPSTRLMTFNPFEGSDIMVMNAADGSGLTDLSKVTEPADCASFDTLDSGFTCAQDQKPAWSPDGTKIAFFSNKDASGLYPGEQCSDVSPEDAPSTCDDEIWVMSADGTNPTQITNNDVNDINPDWQRIPPPPAPPAAPPVVPPAAAPKVGVAGVRRACVSKSFHIRFTIATSSTVKSVVVKLDGKRIKSTKRNKFTLTVNSKKLKAGRHRLTITATDSAGKVTTTHKTFSVCRAAKPRHKSAPRFTG